MISKENSSLIFDPKFFVKLEIYKQTRILLFHLKNMKYSQRCRCLWRENLLSYDNMLGFFQMLRRSKDVIFHEKNIHKILLDCSENNLFNIFILIIN